MINWNTQGGRRYPQAGGISALFARIFKGNVFVPDILDLGTYTLSTTVDLLAYSLSDSLDLGAYDISSTYDLGAYV